MSRLAEIGIIISVFPLIISRRGRRAEAGGDAPTLPGLMDKWATL